MRTSHCQPCPHEGVRWGYTTDTLTGAFNVLAPPQEFGLIHTRRLGRVREAFAAQCGVAQRRNQNLFERLREVREEMQTYSRYSRNVLCPGSAVVYDLGDPVADVLQLCFCTAISRTSILARGSYSLFRTVIAV